MQMLFNSSLVLHIIAGYGALVLGLLIMIGTKGNPLHIKMGRVFFYLMLGVTLSALLMSILKKNDFLLYIGIFVLYQNYGGWKSIRVKSLVPDIWDLGILAAALINGIAMVITGNIVLIVFGSISLLLISLDLNRYRKLFKARPLRNKEWLARHIGMMVGAYIATLTAFLTVNVQNIQPSWVVWLAPTAILVPLLQYWTWKYTRKQKMQLIHTHENQ